MNIGLGRAIRRLGGIPELQANLQTYVDRLNDVCTIKEVDLHIEEVTGEDKTVDVVVDIFNMVNSGGTKLSSGDLALAKICAEWPEARDQMKVRLSKWRAAQFDFRLEWLLRCVNAVLTGQAPFSALANVDQAAFQAGLGHTERAVDVALNLISARLGLDHDRVLGSRYSFPLLARYLVKCGGRLPSRVEQDKLLYWYVHTLLWGRYSGTTESVLNQDLGLVRETAGALDRLIAQLRQNRGDLTVHPTDFSGWSQGARFYPLLYMLTRVWHAKDWDMGVELSSHLLGRLSRLELHHIFPKARLRQHGYSLAYVNAIANFTFLTKETNLLVSDRDPAQYLEEFAGRHPGVVESHWIPMDRELWQIGNYREFLKARRELLAKAANEFLDGLITGAAPEPQTVAPLTDIARAAVPGGVASDEEDRILRQCSEWVIHKGLPEGEYMYELANPDTGEVVAILDLAWPAGLQQGLSQPVALLLDEGQETVDVVNAAGYRYFTDVDGFQKYVEREILAARQEAT
jgi:hypothetical protein